MSQEACWERSWVQWLLLTIPASEDCMCSVSKALGTEEDLLWEQAICRQQHKERTPQQSVFLLYYLASEKRSRAAQVTECSTT